MLASRTSDGLLGLDRSIPFSSVPLAHVIIVIHGLGDQYTDSPPWISALETNIRHLQRSVSLLHDPESRPSSAPEVLLVPLEYHAYAQHALARALAPALPSAACDATPAVRVGLSETVGDLLLVTSARFRDGVCAELQGQVRDQLAAVRRARPAWGEQRVSVFAHSTGAVYALQMLAAGVFDDIQGFDALVMAGSPAPAFFVMDESFSERLRKGVAERRRNGVRIVNVYHAVDPACYRLEPWLVGGEKDGRVRAPVRVAQADRQPFWNEASAFFDGTVQNVLSTLFPHRRTEDQRTAVTTADSSGRVGVGSYGATNVDISPGAVRSAGHVSDIGERSRPPREERRRPRPLRRSKSYVVQSGGDVEKKDIVAGREVLLGDHVDYELENDTDGSQIDMMTNWAAVRAHGVYWRSPDVAQILVDISRTSLCASERGLDSSAAVNYLEPTTAKK